MITETCTFRIWRFDTVSDKGPYYREYALDVPEGMTVLEALLRIQAGQDGSLAFRYACRGAVCKVNIDSDGRTYTIQVTAMDNQGNAGFAETRVIVPHSN